MKRKIKLSVIAAFIMVLLFSFHLIYSDVYIMTDEEYAQEAQKIVNGSLSPCQALIKTSE